MTDKVTIRLDSEVRETACAIATERGLSLSAYIRSLIDSDAGPSRDLPPAIRDVVDAEVGKGLYYDDFDCLVHYARIGMVESGLIPGAGMSMLSEPCPIDGAVLYRIIMEQEEGA